jgi:hypothetical protein
MATPAFIRVNGKVYKRVEGGEYAPSVRGEYQKIVDAYFDALSTVNGEEDIWVIKDALVKAKRVASEVEKQLPDVARPKNWSIDEQFVGVAAKLASAEKAYLRAKKAVDRRRHMAKFARERGIAVPTEYLE